MHRLVHLIVIAILFLAVIPGGRSAAQSSVLAPPTQASLVAETGAVRPGQSFWAALRLVPPDDWYTYWRNPGDAGLPTSLSWQLPGGMSAGGIAWPIPERIEKTGLVSFGYHGETFLPIRITVSGDVTGPVRLKAKASWLVCKEICIPQEADVALNLPLASEAATPSQWADEIAAALGRLPQPSPWPATVSLDGADIVFRLQATDIAPTDAARLQFMPYEGDAVDYAVRPRIEFAGSELVIRAAAAPSFQGPLAAAGGLLVFGDGDKAYEVLANAPAVAGVSQGSIGVAALLTAALFALLGGIILNAMPCVLPILSVKAFGLAQQADTASARRHGVFYAFGVLATFLSLAGILLALRSAGAGIGWGYQLQSPLIVAALAYLMLVLGLSMSGAVDLGNGIANLGARFGSTIRGGGDLDAFASGALAVVVAAPCTAPFMGTAMGVAFTQSWPVALAIFAALAAGFALPYVALCWSGRARRLLPRPGAWMVRLRQFLAFPLYGTAVWLVWVLAVQTGPDGVVRMLSGAVLLAFALWLVGTVAMNGLVVRRVAQAAAIAVALGTAWLVLPLGAQPSESTARASGSAEAYSDGRLAEYRAAGRPVFVNATAAWCVTCIVNERLALSSDVVKDAFAKANIAYLKADWTNQDPTITAFLERFGRAGVPLYVFYPPGQLEPVLLPQILTPSIVVDAITPVTAASAS